MGWPKGRKRAKRASRPMTEAQRVALEALHERQRARKSGEAPSSDQPFPNPLDTHAPARESSRSRIPAAVRRDAKTVLAFTVAGADRFASLSSKLWADRAEGRTGFWTVEDQLSKDETTHLVNAAYAELADYPKLVEKIAAIASGRKHAYLGYVATMIALPRLIRHGIVSEDDPLVSVVLFAQLAIANQLADFERDDDDQPEPPVSVAPGPTPEHYWGNGNGQIDPRGVSAAVADVGVGSAEQAG
jgi:hypothetical protein